MMKAKDTVMSQVQRDNIFYHGIGTLEGVCKLQAEISFKAGIKEVVEWIEEYVMVDYAYGGPVKTMWKTFLKEKGIG